MNITITTAAETITFFSAADFINWDNNENQHRIDAYRMIDCNGKQLGNKGMNAGADLYEMLELIAA